MTHSLRGEALNSLICHVSNFTEPFLVKIELFFIRMSRPFENNADQFAN